MGNAIDFGKGRKSLWYNVRTVAGARMAGAIVLIILCTGGCATFPMKAQEDKQIDVVAHRGASAYAPENTLTSYRLAHEMHADFFELDCSLTKDDRVIILHDHTLDRTTNGHGDVSDYTLAELKKLDAGSWKAPKFAGEPLPTLAEALDYAKGKIGVYIEIKNSADDTELMKRILGCAKDERAMTPALAQKVMSLIEESGTRNLPLTRKVIALIRERHMEKEVVVQSFSPIVCAVATIEAPELRVELLGGQSDKDPTQWDRYLRWCYLLDVAGFNTNGDSLTIGRLAALRAAGKTVAIWTVDSPADMRHYAEWGVNRIITNRPDVCLSTLRDMGRHQ